MNYQVIETFWGKQRTPRGSRKVSGRKVLKEFKTKTGANKYYETVKHRKDKHIGIYIVEKEVTK